MVGIDHNYNVCIQSNPPSAVIAIWHHIIVRFEVLAQKWFIAGNLDILGEMQVDWEEKCPLMGAMSDV